MGEWKEYRLYDILNLIGGGTPKTSNSEFWGGEIGWLSVVDFNGLKYVSKTEKSITQKGFDNSSTSLLNKGELIVSARGTVGAISILTKPMAFNQSCFGISAKVDIIENEFLYYVIKSKINSFIGNAQGQVFDSISKNTFKDINVTIPVSLIEQSTIISILTTIDQAIEKTEQLIAKYERIKTGLMQDLLTRGIDEQGNIRREETHAFKDSVLGRIPKEWEVEKISTYCDNIFLGLTSKVDYVNQGGFPLVRAKDINNGVLSFDEILSISEAQHRKLTRNRRAKNGDILVSKSGTLGTCAIVDTDREFSIYESIIVLQPKEERLDSNFLLWILRDEETQQRLLGEKVGSTIGHLNIIQFRELVLVFPELEEQKKIGILLNEMDILITEMNSDLAKFSKIKVSLMQDLLTGKVRVDTLIKTTQTI